jgi:heat shock protein HtpX
MSITATRFATHLRTWLLIAALTGLLIAIGAAIGGGFLYAFVFLAVGMNLVGYWFSDKIALRASRAQPLEEGQAVWLRRIVADLADRASVPIPRLYLIPSDQPNAFATGRNPQHATVAVTVGLLEQLPADQVRGVLAHEFAHIKNHDILISSIAAIVAGAVSAVATVLQFSRRGAPLADALATLERGAQAIPMNVSAAEASLYAVNPLPRRGLATLFMTHPPIAERIRRLRALDSTGHRQMGAGMMPAGSLVHALGDKR